MPIGYRKFVAYILSNGFYLAGCILTGVPVEGGIFVTFLLIFTGGNAAVKFANGKVAGADA